MTSPGRLPTRWFVEPLRGRPSTRGTTPLTVMACTRSARGPDLVRHGVPFRDEEPSAALAVIPVLPRPAGRVALHVQIAAPLGKIGRVGVRPRARLAEIGELHAVAGPAIGARD